MTLLLELIHRSVSGTGRNHTDTTCTAIEGKLDRTQRPLDPFGLGHERRAEQHERANRDVVLHQKPRRASEVIGRHAFVEPRQDVRVNGLQTERDFEPRSQQIAKPQTSLVGQPRMILDDDPFESSAAGGDVRPVRWRDRRRIEKIPAVVQLQDARLRQTAERKVDLPRNRSAWCWLIKRLSPEITVDAAERTFSIGEKQRRDVQHTTV